MRRRLKTFAQWKANRDRILAQWFPDHVATLDRATLGGFAVQHLVWKKLGTRNYRIDYLCDGPHLIITGDLGDAIYEAGGDGIQWWAGISLGSVSYFASKCVASELGRGNKEWDEDYARINLRDRFAQDGRDGAKQWRALIAEGGLEALHSEQEWSAWLNESADAVWGPNWSDHEPWGLGRVVSLRCEGHLIGLKLALKQLGVMERAA